jgi:hypothetical protein
MCKDDSELTQFQKAERSSLVMNVPYTEAVDHEMLCSGTSRTHISRNWNIILHMSRYGLGCKIKDGSEYLNEVFRERWISRGSSSLPTPLDWPPRNPDLSPCDNSLWSFLKDMVAQQCYQTAEDFRLPFKRVTLRMLQKMFHRT